MSVSPPAPNYCCLRHVLSKLGMRFVLTVYMYIHVHVSEVVAVFAFTHNYIQEVKPSLVEVIDPDLTLKNVSLTVSRICMCHVRRVYTVSAL